MTNDRNAQALAELLHEIIPNENGGPYARLAQGGSLIPPPKGTAKDCDFCQDAARRLVASGVLVPSAMTDEQCEDAAVDPQLAGLGDYVPRMPDGLRQALERIAKGLPVTVAEQGSGT